MNTPTNKLEIVVPKFRWDQMQADLANYRLYVGQLKHEKRRLCEVIATLIMQAGNKVVVTRETIEEFVGTLNIQIVQLDDGSIEYQVFDPTKKTEDAVEATASAISDFQFNGQEFYLFHHNDDDHRTVGRSAGEALITFNTDLNVLVGENLVGRLIAGQGNRWEFVPNTGDPRFVFSTLVPVKDYHWKNIQEAEVIVAQHLMKDMTL